MNHTPGPWIFAPDPSGIATVAWCGSYRIGPDTGHGDPHMAHYDEHGLDEADARLIAAAPDMLALLGQMENWLRPEVVKEPDRTFFWKIVELRRKIEGRELACSPEPQGHEHE